MPNSGSLDGAKRASKRSHCAVLAHPVRGLSIRFRGVQWPIVAQVGDESGASGAKTWGSRNPGSRHILPEAPPILWLRFRSKAAVAPLEQGFRILDQDLVRDE